MPRRGMRCPTSEPQMRRRPPRDRYACLTDQSGDAADCRALPYVTRTMRRGKHGRAAAKGALQAATSHCSRGGASRRRGVPGGLRQNVCGASALELT